MITYTDAELCEIYCRDASNFQGGSVEKVVIPETLQELIEEVRFCIQEQIPLTVAGGRTGLVAGAVPEGGVLISTERLRSYELQEEGETATFRVQPGVPLQEMQEYVEGKGWFYPPDPTERSSFIGGNIATNASGARSFLYGATRHYVQQLRVLLGTGEIVTLHRGKVFASGLCLSFQSDSGTEYRFSFPMIPLPKVSKHNAGLFLAPDMDAIDLFIGSEGILGVILEATVKLVPLPERVFGIVAFFDSEQSALAFVCQLQQNVQHRRASQKQVVPAPRLIEFLDAASLQLIQHQFPHFPPEAKAAIWIEQECTATTEEELLEKWYALILHHSALADKSWIATERRQMEQMQMLRHAVSEAVYERICALKQTKIGTDMAVPQKYTKHLYDFYRDLLQTAQLEHVLYGHIGDAHLHANIFAASPEEQDRAWRVYDQAVDQVLQWEGTISAEHGIGKLKKRYLQKMYGAKVVEEFRRIKKLFDPYWVINPGTMV